MICKGQLLRSFALLLLSALPVAAEEEDDGIAEFFSCMSLVTWSADVSPAAEACFAALEGAVPGWCPLMDNQIRTRQGDALRAAAESILATELGSKTDKLDADPLLVEIRAARDEDMPFVTCPTVADEAVPPGVSKGAICHQRSGWDLYKRALSRAEPGS